MNSNIACNTISVWVKSPTIKYVTLPEADLSPRGAVWLTDFKKVVFEWDVPSVENSCY